MVRGGLEQACDFILNAFQFIEPQSRIGHDEDVAGRSVFVNQEAPIRGFFGLNLFQHALALEHGGEHVTCARGRGRR